MEKKIINAAAFNALHNQNIVFTKQDFAKQINFDLKQDYKIKLHEKTVWQIIKQLETLNYIDIQNNNIIKTTKSLIHNKSAQKLLLSQLLEEYGAEFDEQYIKELFLKHTKASENTPEEFFDLVQQAYTELMLDLKQNKKIKYKDSLNQVELIK